MSDTKVSMEMIDNLAQYNDFIADNKLPTIILRTNNDTTKEIFTKYSEISGPLIQLGCKVALAPPTFSTKLELIIKVNHKVQYYVKDEIAFILNFLGAIVGVGLKNQLIFYAMICEEIGFKLPVHNTDEFTEINNQFERFKAMKIIEIAKNSNDTIAYLGQMDNRYKLFIPLNSIYTSFQSIRNLHNFLIGMTNTNMDLIVGDIDIDSACATGSLGFKVSSSSIAGRAQSPLSVEPTPNQRSSRPPVPAKRTQLPPAESTRPRNEYALQQQQTGFLYVVLNGKVKAVCLDEYDMDVMRDKFTCDTIPHLADFTPKSMEYSFYPQRVETSELIIKAIEGKDYKDLNLSSYGMKSFEEKVDINVIYALKLTAGALVKNFMVFYSILAEICLNVYPELELSLIKAGYSKSISKFNQDNLAANTKLEMKKAVKKLLLKSNPFAAKIDFILIMTRDINSISEEKMKEINEAIDDIINDKECDKTMRDQLMKFNEIEFKVKCIQVKQILGEYQNNNNDKNSIHLKNMLSMLSSESECLMNEILVTYIDSIIIDENMFGSVKENLKECLNKRFYYKMIAYLVDCSHGSKYKTIHKCLEDLCGASEGTAATCEIVGTLLSRITDQAMFNENHWRELWKNNRFVNIIRSVVNDSRVNSKLLTMGCEKEVPSYVPDDIAEKINERRSDYKELVLPEIIESLTVFKKLVKQMRNKPVPAKFRILLAHSISSNNELRNDLERQNILAHLEWTGKVFPKAIDMNSILKVNEMIDEYEKEREDLAQIERQKSIKLDEYQLSMDEKIAQYDRSIDKKQELGQIEKIFAIVFGSKPKLIDLKDFIQLNDIIERPVLSGNNIKETVIQVMPYVMQKVKMWGCSVLTADSIALMIQKEKKNEPKENENSNRPVRRRNPIIVDEPGNQPPVPKKREKMSTNSFRGMNVPLSRLDTIVGILNYVDPIVGQDVLKIITKFPIAIPLIIKNIYSENKYRILMPWLIQPTIKWESSPGKIIENHLFTNKCKIIVALRLCDVSSGRNGKSTVLNQLFDKKNIFSCCGEAGGKGNKPVTLGGTAEMVFLTQETVSTSLWESVLMEHYRKDSNELIILVNLHGNSLDYPHHLEFFRKIASAYIVFEMTNNEEDIQTKFDELETILGLTNSSKNIFYMAIDPVESEYYEEHMVIDSSKITDDSTIDKLRVVLSKAIKHSNNSFNIKALQTNSALELTEFIETDASNKMIAFIKQNTCKEVKQNLCLQKQTDRNWVTECDTILKTNLTVIHIKNLMTSILSLNIYSRQKAMVHMEREIGILSSNESESARKKYREAYDIYQKTIGDRNHNKTSLNKCRREMTKALTEMDKTNLGLEHIYREFAKMYEFILAVDPEKSLYAQARSYAELLIAGQAIELLDGDSSRLTGNWISAICDSVYQIYPKHRIFVISILGLQSSGKSTLLNALFASNFAVSVGRCTRGLFMRLLFLDKNMQKNMNFDAILLIDTEGLGAPEKQNEEDSEKKDRVMATFAMGVSHLTIINVLGEYMNNLTEILQIAIVSLTRLEKVDISPDILLVQHLTERNSDKITNATKQFSDALENAIKTAEKEDMSLGVRHLKCLDKLRNTISKGKLFHQFRPFKNGATAYSPPSEEYHQDIIALYKTIMETARSSGMKTNFKSWSDMITIFWNAIKDENFMRFKDLKELQTSLELSEKIFRVKSKIEYTFKIHSAKLKQFLNESAVKINNKETNEEKVKNSLEEILKNIPNSCFDPKCKSCDEMLREQRDLYTLVKDKPNEPDIQSTILIYIKDIRDSNFNHLKQMLSADAFKRIESENNYLKIERRLKDELKNNCLMDEKSIKRITDEIWSELEDDATIKVVKASVMKKINEEIEKVYSHYPGFVKECEKKKNISLSNSMAIDRRNPHDQTIFSNFQKARNVFRNDNNQGPYDETTGRFKSGFIYELEKKLKNIPKNILTDQKVDTYLEGMVANLREILQQHFNEIEAKDSFKLTTEFKWDMIIFAINEFKNTMATVQKKWDELNDPYVILQSNKDKYIKWIGDRLRNGFGYHSDGSTAGIALLTAIKQKAVNEVNDSIYKEFRDQNWISSAEKIRLLYLSELVAQIKIGEYDRALKFFDQSQLEFIQWYNKRVENIKSEKEIKALYDKIIEKDYQLVYEQVQSLSTVKEAKDYIDELIANCDGIYVRYSATETVYTENDSELFRKGIIEAFEREKQKILCENIIKTNFIDLREDKSIMDLIGCTHACPICTALCWMPAGHEENVGQTSLHHTCHQPMGLSGTRYVHTNELNVDSCHDQKHVGYWTFGERSNVTFEELKKLKGYDKTWRFEHHSQIHFNELMYWFFFKLQKRIAQDKDCKEAKVEHMSYYHMPDLAESIDVIMANVNDVVYKRERIDIKPDQSDSESLTSYSSDL